MGTDKACVEIELKGKPGEKNIVIRREIRKDGSSSWRINGQPVNASFILDTSVLIDSPIKSTSKI